jgi:hypothetical protein
MPDTLPPSSLQINAVSNRSEISDRSINPKQPDPTFDVGKSEDIEKCAEDSTTGSDQDEVEEMGPEDVVYRYLEFSTEVPTPVGVYTTPKEGQEPPPPEPDLVRFTSPFEWPESKKSLIIWISCAVTTLTAFTAGAYSPGLGQMTEEWHVSNVAVLAGITTFCSGKYIFIIQLALCPAGHD